MIRQISEFVDHLGIGLMKLAYRDRKLLLDRQTIEERIARLPKDPHSLFGTPVQPFNLQKAIIGETVKSGLRWMKLAYPSPQPSGHPENDRVILEWVRDPRLSRTDPLRPTIISVPGYRQHSWGDVFTVFAQYMVRRGWDVVLVEHPYHFSRRPRFTQHGEMLVSFDPATTLAGFSQGVMDVRVALAAFQAANAPRLALMGTSLGGLIARSVAVGRARFGSTRSGVEL